MFIDISKIYINEYENGKLWRDELGWKMLLFVAATMHILFLKSTKAITPNLLPTIASTRYISMRRCLFCTRSTQRYTLSWFWAYQSMLFLLNDVCLSGKATNTNLIFFGLSRTGSNAISSTLEANTLTMQFTNIWVPVLAIYQQAISNKSLIKKLLPHRPSLQD